jgi:hypothetical protein
MSRRFPLQSLVDLSADRVDAAERRLQALHADRRHAQEKLDQVEAYRVEYRERLDIISAASITKRHAASLLEGDGAHKAHAATHRLSNFQLVLEVLDAVNGTSAPARAEAG